jgi:outer membrane murein-binding lipoprotein Lpp
MAVADLLRRAEQLIQANADPDAVHRYARMKSQILFGSLAEPIARYQRENHQLAQTLERLQGDQPHDLASWVRFQLLGVFSPFGPLPSVGDDLCAWGAQIMRKAEAQVRVDIDRCKSNNSKVNHRIESLIDQPSTERASGPSPNNDTRVRIRQLHGRLSHERRELRHQREEAQQLAGALAELAAQHRAARDRMELAIGRNGGIREKLGSLVGIRARLEAAVKKATDDVQATKMTQRFGRSAKLSRNRVRMDSIVGLKAEIERLRREREEMEAKKRAIMIDCVRASQQAWRWKRLGIDM